MPWLSADLGPGVTAVVTTRADGVSVAPYASLNLGYHVGDDAAAVRTNRERVAAVLGVPVAYADQVHGATVAVVDRPPDGPSVGTADALVTSRPGLALAIMVADCVPVLVADAQAGVVAAVHVGRRGLLAGVVAAAMDAMTGLGAHAERTRAFLGPAICGSCYEVGVDDRAEVATVVPTAAATTAWGTASVDLEAGVLAQLAALSVRSVVRSGVCTREDGLLFSYRRDGATGRFAGVVVLDDRDTPHPPS